MISIHTKTATTMTEALQKVENIESGAEALTPAAVAEQVRLIQEVMHALMHEGEHYGSIPGCGDKPVLLKPGAEKLSLTFRLAPRYTVTRHDLEDGHREYEVLCELVHVPTGRFAGQGVGSCSTLESKFRYRQASRKCPKCNAEAIIKGKAEYGGGWICFSKKGGCGAKFAENDPSIVEQPVGRVENPDIADYYNTVLKMAKKRAHVDAILTATAASDLFTQDLEDLVPDEPEYSAPRNRVAEPVKEIKPNRAEPANDYAQKFKMLEGVLKARRPEDLKETLDEADRGISSWPVTYERSARVLIEKLRMEYDERMKNLARMTRAVKTALANGEPLDTVEKGMKDMTSSWPAHWQEYAQRVFDETRKNSLPSETSEHDPIPSGKRINGKTAGRQSKAHSAA